MSNNEQELVNALVADAQAQIIEAIDSWIEIGVSEGEAQELAITSGCANEYDSAEQLELITELE